MLGGLAVVSFGDAALGLWLVASALATTVRRSQASSVKGLVWTVLLLLVVVAAGVVVPWAVPVVVVTVVLALVAWLVALLLGVFLPGFIGAAATWLWFGVTAMVMRPVPPGGTRPRRLDTVRGERAYPRMP